MSMDTQNEESAFDAEFIDDAPIVDEDFNLPEDTEDADTDVLSADESEIETLPEVPEPADDTVKNYEKEEKRRQRLERERKLEKIRARQQADAEAEEERRRRHSEYKRLIDKLARREARRHRLQTLLDLFLALLALAAAGCVYIALSGITLNI